LPRQLWLRCGILIYPSQAFRIDVRSAKDEARHGDSRGLALAVSGSLAGVIESERVRLSRHDADRAESTSPAQPAIGGSAG